MSKSKGKNKAASKGLGKGLSALIAENQTDLINPGAAVGSTQYSIPTEPKAKSDSEVDMLSIDLIQPGKYQPRKIFDTNSIRELSESIKENGVIQPIVVMPMGKDGKHIIVAGERRWRASTLAGLTAIPAIVKDYTEKQALEIALIENIQRKDLTVVEEAEGYQKLITELGYTQEDLAKSVGKSRSHISNLMRLLGLPEEVKDYINEGKLSMGHARALLKADDIEFMAAEVINRGLSVRETENLIRKDKKNNSGDFEITLTSTKSKEKEITAEPASPADTTSAAATPTVSDSVKTPIGSIPQEKDADILQLEKMLSESLGLHVIITDHGNIGKVEINFTNLEQLDTILRRLGGGF